MTEMNRVKSAPQTAKWTNSGRSVCGLIGLLTAFFTIFLTGFWAVLWMATPLHAQSAPHAPASSDQAPLVAGEATPSASGVAALSATSPRLIVELTSPPLVVATQNGMQAAWANGILDVTAPAAQTYLAQLEAEQAAFLQTLQRINQDATVAHFLNETGLREEATYQIAFNGLAIDVGARDREQLQAQLSKVDGVKRVYLDQPYVTQLYTSTALINAPLLWNQVGGRTNAGAGIKVASMDGGVHHAAPMMDGAGYTYPTGYGPNGLGITANNNGKIIVSRAYFRPWDPPAAGDENAWPGERGTSHGMHTASTAAGDIVTATYDGLNVGIMSGVAPKAYVMSYRVFYESVTSNGSFYTVEGLAALEDIVRDRADVLNNSWGEGPKGNGGEFDALDQALINVANAGIFVAMSNGNAGPGLGTSDHPSPNYINVAASTTGGTIASQRLSVPSEPTLQNITFAGAVFGGELPENQTQTFAYVTATTVNAANSSGCAPFAANSLTGKAVLLDYTSCEFGQKALNAQQAGAAFVIVYNSDDEQLYIMGPGEVGGSVTIPAIFVARSTFEAMDTLYRAQGAAAAILEVNTTTHQAGNTPDHIIDFSSRGPGVGGVLKPDIAAPGVNILAQGYTPGASGEARHLGYGQASGTSMAAPHVAGAAALVKQAHPEWSPAQIKSALMTTAKYRDIYLDDGTTPAQPLDMGAGRLDLSRVTDPGVILDPPSLSFGNMVSGTQKSITVNVTSVAATTESYTLSTLYTGNGYTQTTTLPGMTIQPASITLAPGATTQFSVTFASVNGQGVGDNQGYVIFDGSTYAAHMPAWARVTPALPLADVLLIDGDVSNLTSRMPDYRWYYTDALSELGLTYTVLDYDPRAGASLPDAATLLGYRAIIYFTGDNYFYDAGLDALDMDKLVEYLNAGGTLIAMGQDLAATIQHAQMDPVNPHYFYAYRLGANWIQDSVSADSVPEAAIVGSVNAPQIFADLLIDPTQPRADAGTVSLNGAASVPPVSTPLTGTLRLYHDRGSAATEFALTLHGESTTPRTVTGMHIHTGAAGATGPVIVDLAVSAGITLPTVLTDTWTASGLFSPTLTAAQVTQLRNNELYVNVHTTAHPDGEIRAQLAVNPTNYTLYIDEIDNEAHDGTQDPTGQDARDSIPILRYLGPNNEYDGTVAIAHRQQPSLSVPGITYQGRSIYTTFGLESVGTSAMSSLTLTPTTGPEMLAYFLDWGWSEPAQSVAISHTTAISDITYTFRATALYAVNSAPSAAGQQFAGDPPTAVSYHWDFDDGSGYSKSSTAIINHSFLCTETSIRTVRVAVTDSYGNVAIGTQAVDVGDNCRSAPKIYMPYISKN